MLENRSFRWLFRLSILLLLFLCSYIFLKLSPLWKPVLDIILAVFVPFFIASFLTYLLHPVVEKMHNLGVPRSLAIIFIYFTFFGTAGFALYKGFPMIVHQLKDLGENIPFFMDIYRQWIDKLYLQTSSLPDSFHSRIEQSLLGVEEFVSEQIAHTIQLSKRLLNSIILFVIIPFISFYLLKDFDLVCRTTWYLTPRRFREPGRKLLSDIDDSLGNYIRGQLLVCLFVGVMATIALWVTGMKYPLLLGAIIGLTNVIPYFGPILGAVPAAIIAATMSVKMIIIVVIIVFILQLVEGNLLSPLIVGKSLHMHPIFIILALLIGEEIGGVIGLLLAVPMMAVLKVTASHIILHFRST
jgi:predicted PurR-regulated permease PerM